MKLQRKLMTTVLVLSLVTPNQAFGVGCSEVIEACDLTLQAKDNEIAGLEDALKQSRDQTDKTIKKKEEASKTSLGTILEAAFIGAAVGVLLGVGVSK